MGMKSCARKGCESTMCGRFSHKHGYICSDCFAELAAINPSRVSEFMSEPRSGSDLTENPEDKFDREFPEEGG